jgi:hypothetical protein
MVHARQRLIKQAEVAQKRCCGIAVERRADLGGNLSHRHILGMQNTVTIQEMIHLSALPS